jgi:hypothetical protein
MAPKVKDLNLPDDAQLEKERIEREKKEEEELKKKIAEKEKKKKEREKRAKEKQKKEMKKIRTLINLPFNILIKSSLLITTLAFIIMYFGIEKPLNVTVFNSFLIFVGIYLGVGLIMIGIFFLISQDKIVEMEEQRKIDSERMDAEKKKEEEELAQMVEIEKEIAAKKLAGKSIREDRKRELDMYGETSTTGISELDFMSMMGDEQNNKPKAKLSDKKSSDLNEEQFMNFDDSELDPFSEDEGDFESGETGLELKENMLDMENISNGNNLSQDLDSLKF